MKWEKEVDLESLLTKPEPQYLILCLSQNALESGWNHLGIILQSNGQQAWASLNLEAKKLCQDTLNHVKSHGTD